MPLIERDESVLIVIDAQPGFSGATDEAAVAAGRSRQVAAWLAGVAAALGIPIIATEENSRTNGPTDPAIVDRLPADTPVFAKPVFGLADVPEILAAVESKGRRTAVLVGAETDVCVAQSAIGLHDRGYRVVVVSDATFSPGEMHDHGLRHVRDAGEWIRRLDAALAFEAAHSDLADPPGFRL